MEPIRLLLVEDQPLEAELVKRHFRKSGVACVLQRVDTEPDFRRAISEFAPDVIISDHSMPRFDGISALKIARATAPATPFIFFSGTIGEKKAIEYLNSGATDYVLKGNAARLPTAVERALRDKAERAAHQCTLQALNSAQTRLTEAQSCNPVTGLPNRASFCDELERSRLGRGEGAGGITVGIVDIERFRLIEESLGLDAALALLRQFAARLQGLPGVLALCHFGADVAQRRISGAMQRPD